VLNIITCASNHWILGGGKYYTWALFWSWAVTIDARDLVTHSSSCSVHLFLFLGLGRNYSMLDTVVILAHSQSRRHSQNLRVIKQTHIKNGSTTTTTAGETLYDLWCDFSSAIFKSVVCSRVSVKLIKESCVAGDPKTSSLMTRLYSPSQERYICFNRKGKVRAVVSWLIP